MKKFFSNVLNQSSAFSAFFDYKNTFATYFAFIKFSFKCAKINILQNSFDRFTKRQQYDIQFVKKSTYSLMERRRGGGGVLLCNMS